MKHTLLFLFCFITLLCNAQENCNNGIDDDGDGKIDLNDSDCICKNSEVTSIIPNPSFETKSGCPSGFSELYLATPWIQATEATTDYHNNCGFVGPAIKDLGLDKFPDGNGIAAALFLTDWNEYLGATLLSPMTAGTNYQLTFNIAAMKIYGNGSLSSNSNVDSLEPVNVTLYGCENGKNLPLPITSSPDLADPTWIEIGNVTYTPSSTWGEITISFTPKFDVKAIMLGAPPILPSSYPGRGGIDYPYFLFDNLLLNTAASFGVNISQNGNFCDNNLVLKADITTSTSTKKTYQWYQNGIAISGATAATYKIQSFSSSLGQYSVKVTDGDNCYISTKITINNTIPGPSFTIIQPNCIEPTGSISIKTPASEYSFDNGKTWQTSPDKDALPVGIYYVKIKTLSGCVSSSTGASILEPNLLSNSDFSVVQPTTCDGKGSITIKSTNAAQYSYDDGVTWTTNSTASDLEPGNYLIKIKDATGCQSASQYVPINRIFLKDPVYSTIQPSCGKGGQITINTVADLYSFDEGKTWTTDNIAKDLAPAYYFIKIKNNNGCESNTVYVNIEQFYLKVYPTFTTTQPVCGTGGTITITSEASEFSFDGGKTWSTNPVASDLLPGYYSILFKNELGCISYTQSVNLNYFYLPNPTYTFTKPTCETGGSITITTVADEYSFDNGNTWTTNPTASNLPPGTYYIMIKNKIGCTSSTYQYVNLDYFFLPDPLYKAVNPSCGNIGSIEITTKTDWYSFDGGYTWSANPKATNLSAGYYYLKVKNNFGCESNTIYVYLDSNYLASPNYTLTEATCTKQASITITTKADFYSFDNGNTWVTNPTLSNLTPNDYRYIKIKNNSGCMSDYVPISIKPFRLENPLYTIVQPTCGNGGNITITTPADFYSFDDGNTWTTNPTLSNLTPNNYYYIKIKNNLGCTSENQYVHTEPFFLKDPNYTVVQPSCGVSGKITITTTSDFYSFDNGNTWTTNPVLSNPQPNNYYYLLIKNNLGCISKEQYVYIQPYYLDNPLYTIKQPTCENSGNITITTPSDFYSFDDGNTWTTNPVLSKLTPGNYYYIKIKNNLGCISGTQYVYIEPLYLDNPNYTVVQPSCGDSGSITITTKSDFYSFDNGYTWTTNPTLSNLQPYTYYYIVIKNNFGCISNYQYVYIEPYFLADPTYQVVTPSCKNGGSITITSAADQYSFDGGNTWTTNPVLLNPASNYYYLKIKNNKGCESNYVGVYTSQAPYIPSKPKTTSVSPSNCGAKDGSITITTTGISYSFDDGVTWQTNSKATSLEAGTYLVRIKETSWDCPSAATTVVLSSKTSLAAPKFSIIQPTCSLKTGKITITTSASFYSFDNGVTWQTVNSKDKLVPGKYLVKIKNDKGCISDAATADITVAPLFKIDSYTTEQPECAGELVTGLRIDIVTPASEYSFDNGLTWSTSSFASNLKANTQYCLKIKNTQGCISEPSCMTTIKQNAIPTAPKLTIKQPIGCDDDAKGTITVNENKYQYSFDNGLTWTTNKTSGPLLPGSYFIRTKEIGSECISYAAEAVINNPPDAPNTPEVTIVQPTTCANPFGTIAITTVAAAYSFDNGKSWSTNPNSGNIAIGTYLVKIKNSVGCESPSFSAAINKAADSPTNPTATLIQPDCSNAKGKITITSASSEYSFDNGNTWTTATTSTFLNAGDYLIKVKNSNGCISEASKVTLIPFTEFTANPVVSNPQTFCIQQNAAIDDIIITGQNIKWYDTVTAGTLLLNTALLQDGKTYYASQTIDGCESKRAAVAIKIQDTPAPTGNSNQPFCSDQNPTVADIMAVGQNIKWYNALTNGNTLSSNTSLQNGMTYYASQTVNSCESNRLAVTVSIQNTPGIPTGDTNPKFCKSEKAALSNITINGQNLKWYDSNTAVTPLANTTLVQNNTTYYVSQTIGCESDRLAVLTNVNDTPLAIASASQTFCIDENATIANIAVTGQNLIWYDAPTAGNVLTPATILENKTYYVTQTSANCESERLRVVIKIQDTQPPIGDANQSFCVQQNATIKTIKINGEDIKWYTAMTAGTSLSESTPLETGITYYASQTIHDCESERTPIVIQIQEATTADCINFVDELPFPKFFTPNNDGYNDTWTIDFIYLEPNSTIRIFDRYGKFIKELPVNTSWDGNYLNQPLPSTDYWFLVKRLNGAAFKSHFSLKR